MDMGFTREMAADALVQCGNVQTAADLLLAGGAQLQFAQAYGVPLDEEEQLQQAIAMSLTEHETDDDQQPAEQSSSMKAEKVNEIKPILLSNVELTVDDSLEAFVNETLLEGIGTLVFAAPSAVYRVADVISLASRRCGSDWTRRLLVKLVSETEKLIVDLLHTLKNSPTEQRILPKAQDLIPVSTRLHLMCLIFTVSVILE